MAAMTLDAFLAELKRCPLIASVQASEGSPLEHPPTLARLASASAQQGVRILRAQGIENIRAIKEATGLPVIGLIKRTYEGSEVYITPTSSEVEALIEAGCEVIALDGTRRERPDRVPLGTLIDSIHLAGRLVLADCDELDSMQYAVKCGADMVSTTLSGYTGVPPPATRPGPALWLLRRAVEKLGVPVLAEGRFADPREAQSAVRLGAAGVVVGGALNDPVKQTAAFARAVAPFQGRVGAVDIGGTWLRFGVCSPDWQLERQERIPLPSTRKDRMAWIEAKVKESGVGRLGVSSGGTIQPDLRTVLQSKPSIPQHLNSSFDGFGVPTIALNDGLAAAWGHACHPELISPRTATLALGTGVGCGLVESGRLLMEVNGQTLKLNDLPTPFGASFEELLGGAALTPNPTPEQKEAARRATMQAILTLQAMCMPYVVVVCGGVGMADWLDVEALERECFRAQHSEDAPHPREEGDSKWWLSWVWPKLLRSPFGHDAGLYGAAALALFPPVELAGLLRD